MYIHFYNCLKDPVSENYWGDVIVDEAVELANSLSPDEWVMVQNEMRRWSEQMQTRLAYTIGQVKDSSLSIPVLQNIVEDDKCFSKETREYAEGFLVDALERK